jgi:PAS domain S-box-containing protein
METSYQLLFREMQAGFALHEIILDDTGKPVDYLFLAVNPAFERLTGLKADEVVGRTVRQVLPDIEQFWIDRYGAVALTGTSITFEEYAKDIGRYFQINAYSPAHRQFACTLIDVTDHKQAEKELQKSEDTLRGLLNAVHDSLFLMSLDGTVIAINQTTAERMGSTPEEMIGKDIYTYVSKEVADYRRKQAQKAIESKQIVRITDQRSSRWIESTIFPVLDDSGHVHQLAIYGQDITERRQAEENLRLHTQMLNAVGQAAMATDLQGKIIYWNHAAEMLFGWKAEEVIGRDVVELTPSQHSQEQAKAIMEALMAGQSWSGELNFQRKDGKKLDLAVTDSPVFDDTGKMIGIIGISYDLSERKKAETELYASEERYRTVVAAANEAIILQARSGQILTWNAAAEHLFGLTAQEALGQTSTSRKWETYQEDGSPLPGEKHPSMHTLNTGQPCRDVLVKIVRDDQTFSWANISTNPVFLGDANQPDLVVITIQDVTERKLAEHALKEREREISTLMDNLPGMAYRCKNDKDWSMLFVSQGCFELTGYHPEELIENTGITFQELVHPDDRERIWQDTQAALENSQPFIIEYRIRDRAGQEHWVWERGRIIQGPDGDQTIEGFITDINKRKQAEEKLHQKMNELERFNLLTVDREMRMIELKKEINALLKAAGQPEKYRINP